MRFQVCVPDWALGANGMRATDTLALEHVKDDGMFCLVYSTTLPLDLSDAQMMCVDHLKVCRT